MRAKEKLRQLVNARGFLLKLPTASNLTYVARLRYIQSIHETSDRRNPDLLVRHFIPFMERWRGAWISQEELSKLRVDPFYYYLLARTTYYDQVFGDALADGVQSIISVGCGSDTRSYRLLPVLERGGVRVLECDLPDAILAKQRIARRWRNLDLVDYSPIDLNDGAWPDLTRWLGERPGQKTLVLMEGVSPYIDEVSFRRFLLLLARTLAAGSHVAYDFKIRGVNDDFGRQEGTTTPFRLPSTRDDVVAFHEEQGFQVRHFELSSELCRRLLPSVVEAAVSLFVEDALVRLRVDRDLPRSAFKSPVRRFPSPFF